MTADSPPSPRTPRRKTVTGQSQNAVLPDAEVGAVASPDDPTLKAETAAPSAGAHLPQSKGEAQRQTISATDAVLTSARPVPRGTALQSGGEASLPPRVALAGLPVMPRDPAVTPAAPPTKGQVQRQTTSPAGVALASARALPRDALPGGNVSLPQPTLANAAALPLNPALPLRSARPDAILAPDTSLPAEPPVAAELRACRLCADRFAATATRHQPRPVVWFSAEAKLLIVGQAPGARVHDSGRPFTDPSGVRLRAWMGVDEADFYDRSRVAIVPMGFCFPGYDAKGSDLPPPRLCADTWRARVLAELNPQLTLLVGGHAIRWHLGLRDVTGAVRGWRDHAPGVFPLPHPSWRNTGWLKRNPWFETELVPELRRAVARLL